MRPKISIITLGVSDLETSLHFYRDGLGWNTLEAGNPDNIAFLELEGIRLALYRRDLFPGEAPVEFAQANAGTPTITLAQNFASAAEVDGAMAEAIAAGATPVKQPQEVFWGGYSGYFADPDGYLWELAHNPFDDLA